MKLRLRIPLPPRATLPYFVAAFGAFALLTIRLSTLMPHLSAEEQATLDSGRSLHLIANNPLFAPAKLLYWFAGRAPGSPHLLAARLPGVVLGFITIAALVYILQRWHGRRSIAFGFVLFLTSAAFLHAARSAGFESSFLVSIPALIAVHIALNDHEEDARAWLAWLIVHALLLSIPGMLWFVLLNALWQWRAISIAFRRLELWQKAASAILFCLSVGAVAQGIIRTHALLWEWLGLPTSLSSLHTLPHELLATLVALGYQRTSHPEQWLGTLPLLDVCTLFMVAAGLVFYIQHWRAGRTHMLVSFVVLGLLLTSLGTVSMSLLVPLLYILAAGGIAYALHFWLRAFPRNPLARTFGILLMAVIVALACYYNLVQYYVAWPHNPATIAAFQAKK